MIQVIVKNSKTGSRYICKSASKTVKDIAYKHISYCLVCRHKDHPFFKQFYHGSKGVCIGSERYKEIEVLKERIMNTPMHKLLGLTITETPQTVVLGTQNSYPYIMLAYWRNSPINQSKKQYNYNTAFNCPPIKAVTMIYKNYLKTGTRNRQT